MDSNKFCKPVRVLIALLAVITFVACDAEGGTNDGSSTSSAITVSDEWISNEDGSVTVAAVRDGLDPWTELINTNFACYNEADNDYLHPYLTLSVSGSSYTSSLGSGAIVRSDAEADLYLRGTPFDNNFEVDVQFGSFGQSFDAKAGNVTMECFQYGASLERAFHRFLINTPEIASYACKSTSSDDQQALMINSDGSYSLPSGSGQYRYSNIINYEGTRIDFIDGPLNGETVSYFEHAPTGRQHFRFIESKVYGLAVGSSTSVTSVCDRVRTPRPFKEYGYQAATLPEQPSVQLSGMYFVSNPGGGNSSTFHDYADNYTFTPDGFTKYGTPGAYGTDCTRTQPNGLNYCGSYRVENGEILRYDNTGELINAGAFSINDAGVITSLYEREAELVTPVPSATLSGNWKSDYFRSSGCNTLDYCSYVEIARMYRFTSSEDFNWDYNYSSYTGSVTPISSAASASSDTDNRSGTYQIQANLLVETLPDGRILYKHIYQTHDGSLSIDGYLYKVPEQ